MTAAIALLAMSVLAAGLASSVLYRRYLRRPQRRQTGVPVMLNSWSDDQPLTVAAHLQRKRR
jgi:hypothetical protein